MGPRVGLDGCEKSSTGIRFLDRPSRSESLYRLSYPGPCLSSHARLKMLLFNFCSLCLNRGSPKLRYLTFHLLGECLFR